MKNVANDDKHLEFKEKEMVFFQEKYRTDEVEIFQSPSKQYILL